MKTTILQQALYKKKKNFLTTEEILKINALGRVYGKNLVFIAIRNAKSADIREISRLLVQIGGFRDPLDICLKNGINDQRAAESRFSKEQIEIAQRLSAATRIIFEDQISKIFTNITKENPYHLWMNNLKGVSIEQEEIWAINSSIKKYGVLLVFTALQLFKTTVNLFDHKKRLVSLKLWLEAAASNNSFSRMHIASSLGIIDEFEPDEIPISISLRIERYFFAKTQRAPFAEEKRILWKLVSDYTVDQVIFAMSCVPSNAFSLMKVATKLKEILLRFKTAFTDYSEGEFPEENEAFGAMNNEQLDEPEMEIVEEIYYGDTYGDDGRKSWEKSLFYDYSTDDPDSMSSEDFLGENVELD